VLAGADVSFALGDGSALAQAHAGFVVLGARLHAVAEALGVARRARAIVRQNLAWALAYNVLALPVAALGYAPPWLAAVGMCLSSLAVTANALRLARVPPERATAAQKGRAHARPAEARA
jgi:Cu2+-exporting ATPase